MKIIDLINKLIEFEKDNPDSDVRTFREAHQKDDYDYKDEYYFDGEDDSDEGYKYEAEEIIPFEISPKAISLLNDSKSLEEIFSDCTIYLYGYKVNDLKEYVLAITHLKCKYPFNGIQLDGIDSGTATRFEIVSNNDLYCYMRGGIGFSYGHPMRMAHCQIEFGGSVVISNFELNL